MSVPILLNIKHQGLNGLVKAISENHEVIEDYNTQNLKDRGIKLTLFQSLFSVVEYLKKLNVKNKFVHRQYLSKL